MTSTRHPLPKTYAPADEEPIIRERWRASNAFHPDPQAVVDGRRDPYCIIIPPPNVTAPLHLGHALNNTLQDILIRHHRMRGFETMWMPGTDHAGIATQTVVDKRLRAEGRPALADYKKLEIEGKAGREQFTAKIQAWKDEYEAQITHQLQEMGCSCDWERQRFTMDKQCARAVREAFFRLFRDGLIYRGKRLVNWDPATQTALADDEVEDREIDGHFWYMRYPLVGEPVVIDGQTIDHVTVATTRPETMLGDTAVALNPKDPRAAKLRGRMVRLPIVNREIPIIEDEYVVLPVSLGGDPDDAKAEYATGYLKVTPAHDPNDWDIGQRHDLPVINILAQDGTISDKHGWPTEEFTSGQAQDAEFLLGMDRYEAREAIVDWFTENNLLEEVRPYRHTVGHSYRSHVAIEPYLSDQWWVKVTDDRLRGAALRAMAEDQRSPSDSPHFAPGDSPGGTQDESALSDTPSDTPGRLARSEMKTGLRFFPERYAKTFQVWHENLRDWCISRQLWWGHRIPVWYFRWAVRRQADTSEEPDSKPGLPITFPFLSKEENGQIKTHVILGRDADGFEMVGVCIAPGHPAIEEKLEKKGAVQDPDVLDTWFSSALWPMSIMGWPDEDAALLKAYNPSDVLTTAREIITLWVSRMVMFNLYFLDRLPFEHVFIHAMIQDGDGRKMSKSLGNGVDPLDIIHSHGSDAMRFTLCQMTTNTQDVRMPVVFDDETGKNTSPKFDIGRNFCNKLWNAVGFALSNLAGGESDGSGEMQLVDRWILSRTAQTVAALNDVIASYQFNIYAQLVYDLFWRDFCDYYVEAVKPTVKTNAAQRTVLRAIVDVIVRIVHPVCPFITETLYERLREIDARPVDGLRLDASDLCTTAGWPIVDPSLRDTAVEREFDTMRQLIGVIREARSQRNVQPKRKITLHTDAETLGWIEAAGALVPTLCGIEQIVLDEPTGDHAVITALGRDHAISNLTDARDASTERERLEKNLADAEGGIIGLEKRLSNPGYVDKAPAKLVQQTRDQLASLQEERDTIRMALDRLAK